VGGSYAFPAPENRVLKGIGDLRGKNKSKFAKGFSYIGGKGPASYMKFVGVCKARGDRDEGSIL